MTALETQIVADYENNGASVELLSEEYGLEILTVKALLQTHSRKYKEQAPQVQIGDNLDVSKEEYDTFLAALKNLALGAESESVRKACLFRLVDEHKGRLDKRSAGRPRANKIEQVTNNVIIFNEALKASREKLVSSMKDVVDVEALESKLLGVG